MKRILFAALPVALALACNISTPAVTGNPPASPEPPTAMPDTSQTPAAANTLAAGMVGVRVFFTMAADENMTPMPVGRTVPETDNEAVLLHAALLELVKGPTDAEKAAGLTSWFSSATADVITSVVGGMGGFTVDFTGLTMLIPNASTSAGSLMLLSQVNSTVFQFDFVQTIHYTLDGDCAAFWEWLQMGCHPVTRAEWEAG